MCVAIFWSILFALLEQKHEALPGGKLLTLILLLVAAYTVGDVFKYVGVPKILGMLLSGIFFRNTGLFFDSKEAGVSGVYSDLIATTRYAIPIIHRLIGAYLKSPLAVSRGMYLDRQTCATRLMRK